MVEFLASIGALTILIGGFYVFMYYSSASDKTAEYEYLIKESHWENYFWSWCQDPANVPHKMNRSAALKKFFTKGCILEANTLIKEYHRKRLVEDIKREVLEELKKERERQ